MQNSNCVITVEPFTNHFSIIVRLGEGTTLINVHRKHYTSAQEHLRKGLKPICNEADLSKFLSHLQEAVFGSKGMSCNNTSRKYSVRLSVRQDSGRL